MCKSLGIAFALLLAASGTAFGQEHPHEGTTGSQLSFIWGVPQGAFADHIDRTPFGASLLFGGEVPGTSLFLGTEASLVNYGRREHLELHRIEDVPVQALRVATSHNIAMGHLVARLQLPTTTPVRPYVDALGGLRAFVSKIRVDSDVVVLPGGLAEEARMTDWALSYGVGGGLDLLVHTGRSAFSKHKVHVALNVGARYLFGAEADFVRIEDVQEIDDRFTFATTRSRTDILIPQVGVRVSL